jgi:hypothetical protein
MAARLLKVPVCAWLLLYAATFVHAQPVPGLRVLQVKFSPSELLGQAALVNDGTSTIAAFGLSVTTTLADGREIKGSTASDATQSIFYEDSFSKMSGISIPPEGMKLRAGRHFNHQLSATTSGESKPASLRCEVLFVVFVDGTQAGDPQEIRHQRAEWSKEVKTIQKWLPEMMKLGDSPAITLGEYKKFWERVDKDPAHSGVFGSFATPSPKTPQFDSIPVPPETFRKMLTTLHDAFQDRETLLRKLTETLE